MRGPADMVATATPDGKVAAAGCLQSIAILGLFFIGLHNKMAHHMIR